MTKKGTSTNEILLTTVLTYATSYVETYFKNSKYHIMTAALILNGFDTKLKTAKENSFSANGISFDKETKTLFLCDKPFIKVDYNEGIGAFEIVYHVYNIDTGKEFTTQEIKNALESLTKVKKTEEKVSRGSNIGNILNSRNKSTIEKVEESENAESIEQNDTTASVGSDTVKTEEEPKPIAEKPKDKMALMVEDMVKKHAELKGIPYEEYSEPIMGLTRVYTARAKEHYDEFIASYKKWFPDAEI